MIYARFLAKALGLGIMVVPWAQRIDVLPTSRQWLIRIFDWYTKAGLVRREAVSAP